MHVHVIKDNVTYPVSLTENATYKDDRVKKQRRCVYCIRLMIEK